MAHPTMEIIAAETAAIEPVCGIDPPPFDLPLLLLLLLFVTGAAVGFVLEESSSEGLTFEEGSVGFAEEGSVGFAEEGSVGLTVGFTVGVSLPDVGTSDLFSGPMIAL